MAKIDFSRLSSTPTTAIAPFMPGEYVRRDRGLVKAFRMHSEPFPEWFLRFIKYGEIAVAWQKEHICISFVVSDDDPLYLAAGDIVFCTAGNHIDSMPFEKFTSEYVNTLTESTVSASVPETVTTMWGEVEDVSKNPFD